MKVNLVEDHDKALFAWRRLSVRGADLVHVDAHIDFAPHAAKPPELVLNRARSLAELKRGLELTLAFQKRQKDLSKQINIGNYIYAAMEEGIVRNFHWVVPGGKKEFSASLKTIKKILRNSIKPCGGRIVSVSKKRIEADCLGRKFFVYTLETLPELKEPVILDVDADFLAIKSVAVADNTQKVGKREQWIWPEELVSKLKQKLGGFRAITVAYSVNGGYTPLKFRHLADETAYFLSPQDFKRKRAKALSAAAHFSLFEETGLTSHYRAAVSLNPRFADPNNNYGPLYLMLAKTRRAESEFKRILRADPKNPGALSGMGEVALSRRGFASARNYFTKAFGLSRGELKNQCALGLAKVFLKFGDSRAEKWLRFFKKREPLNPWPVYELAGLFEKKKKYRPAVYFYKEALGLGFGGPQPFLRLAFLAKKLNDAETAGYLKTVYAGMKKRFPKSEAALRNVLPAVFKLSSRNHKRGYQHE